MPELNLVPFPTGSTAARPAYLPLLHDTRIIVKSEMKELVQPLAVLLSEEIHAATSGAVTATIGIDAGTQASASTIIHLVLAPSTKTASREDTAEKYTLTVDPSPAGAGVVVSSATYAGLVAGTATLLQSIEFSGNADSAGWTTPNNCTTVSKWRIPALTITDDAPVRNNMLFLEARRRCWSLN